MCLNEWNLILVSIIWLLVIFGTSFQSMIQSLILAELIWISLYGLSLLSGFIYDDLNVLSLTFFFLIFSAIELASGLILALLYFTFTRSTFSISGDIQLGKFLTRLTRTTFASRLRWKI